MLMKRILMTAAAVLAIGTMAAKAQPAPPGGDPYGYYSQYDQNGYYDRDGRYRRIRGRDRDFDNGPPPPPAYGPPPPSGAYYQQGRYEADCHRGNAAAGTIFGALAGGLIGGAASHGNGGAVVGGAILGGLLGNTVSRDIDCDAQPEAFRVYADGLNGNLGQRRDWRHGDSYGYFTPTREFRRGGVVCREFTETSYSPDGRSFTRSGSACRQDDGNWRFD
jgi:surface antigen